ncbi:MAG TPA: hypothetical protein VLA16_04310 [Ideonella sp.]|nr:hypothetical protein [Ideonella sp.]
MSPPAPSGTDTMARALAADLARHAALGDKVSGGPGDAATAAWIAGRLEALGCSVLRQPLEVPWFEPRLCRLTAGDATAPLYWQSPVSPTGPQGITAPLAVLHAPFEAADAAGCIALLMLPYARHASIDSAQIAPLLDAATAAGALALVIVPTGPSGEVVALNCSPDQARSPLPTAVLAPGLAGPLLQAARSGRSATLHLHGTASRRSTCTLLGELRRGPRWLCLSTPRTGWFGCVGERGTGTAAFLAMAAWAVERFPALSLFFMNAGAHEYRFEGAHRAMARAPAPADTVVWSHLGAALATRDRLEIRGQSLPLPSADPHRFTMATGALREAAARAFQGLGGLEHVMAPLDGVSELGAIVAHGYERAFAVLGVPRMFHTRRDDLETTDAGLLAPVVRAHMAVVEHAVSTDAANRAGLPA